MLDVEKIRDDFPILQTFIYGKPLIYLDNAATTQLPRQVVEAIREHYYNYNGNVHRGIHYLSEQSTNRSEQARISVQEFINAKHSHEVILTKGTTDSVNIVANAYGESFLQDGDEIVISAMEHHSNLVPWQMLCQRKDARLKVIPFNENGELIQDEYIRMLSDKTKLVAVTHISNVFGTVNPIAEMIRIAHSLNVPVLVDGAQSIRHEAIDVQELDCDFFCFSGHKMMGPTGIGVLYAKEAWLNKLNPVEYGGSMVDQVAFAGTTFANLPSKFEAGTPNYVGAIALGEAVQYLNGIGRKEIAEYEHDLLQYTEQQLSAIEELSILGKPAMRAGAVSFTLKNVHPFDLASMIDKMGIAVRSGSSCAQPLLAYFNISAATRVSPAFYNTRAEIDVLIEALLQINKLFNKRGRANDNNRNPK